MTLRPVNITEANEFVGSYHRHNKPTVGARFCIGVEAEGELVGVAIVGRPVARMADNGTTAEVTRVCVNDKAEKGACSMLYSACWRAWRAMGGHKLITYTLPEEGGASLRGAGWRVVGETTKRTNPWHGPDRKRDWQPIFGQQKLRWETPASEPQTK